MKSTVKEREYLKKEIDNLPQELFEEVKDFVEFIIIRKSNTKYNYLLSQQKSLKKIWENDTEDLYEV
ncbi:hypothetical protein KAU15_04815 [candidate division WOR-3 bacterium]|nr:hypothetical protein [candidate division WOR-3 bacterium]